MAAEASTGQSHALNGAISRSVRRDSSDESVQLLQKQCRDISAVSTVRSMGRCPSPPFRHQTLLFSHSTAEGRAPRTGCIVPQVLKNTDTPPNLDALARPPVLPCGLSHSLQCLRPRPLNSRPFLHPSTTELLLLRPAIHARIVAITGGQQPGSPLLCNRASCFYP